MQGSEATVSGEAAAGSQGAAIQSPGEPTVPERVVFSDQKIKGNGGYHARRLRGIGYSIAVLLTWGTIFALIAQLAPGAYAALFAVVGTALIWVALAVFNRVPRELRDRCEGAIAPTGTAGRVRCVGKVKRLARVLEREPIADRLFEPQVFRGTGSTKSTGKKQAAQIIIGIAAGAAVVAGQWHFLHQIGNVYLDFMIAAGAAMVLGGALFPTYLRVVPGRIDVMECGWLGRRILSVKRVNLRDRPVLVDVNRQVVQVGEAADAPMISFGAVWDRWAFAHAVLEASISTHTPPSLPDDALVG